MECLKVVYVDRLLLIPFNSLLHTFNAWIMILFSPFKSSLSPITSKTSAQELSSTQFSKYTEMIDRQPALSTLDAKSTIFLKNTKVNLILICINRILILY